MIQLVLQCDIFIKGINNTTIQNSLQIIIYNTCFQSCFENTFVCIKLDAFLPS